MTTKQAINGRFSKPKGCFSQISNKVLHDPTLSLKAKGLYSLIVSYITLPNFTLYKSFLKSLCSEGRHAFDSAWKELVAAGYLSHTRTRQQDGTFAYEYSLEEKEQELTEHKTPKKQRKVKNEFHQPIINSPESNDILMVDFVTKKEKEPLTENQTSVSYIYNKTITNKNQSIDNTEYWKDKIDYNYFMEEDYFSSYQKIIVTNLLCYLVEMDRNETWETKQLLQTVDSCFISEFLEHMQQVYHHPIKHPIPYWRKAFWNYMIESAYSLTIVKG